MSPLCSQFHNLQNLKQYIIEEHEPVVPPTNQGSLNVTINAHSNVQRVGICIFYPKHIIITITNTDIIGY